MDALNDEKSRFKHPVIPSETVLANGRELPYFRLVMPHGIWSSRRLQLIDFTPPPQWLLMRVISITASLLGTAELGGSLQRKRDQGEILYFAKRQSLCRPKLASRSNDNLGDALWTLPGKKQPFRHRAPPEHRSFGVWTLTDALTVTLLKNETRHAAETEL
jgi:hypothetical protein